MMKLQQMNISICEFWKTDEILSYFVQKSWKAERKHISIKIK